MTILEEDVSEIRDIRRIGKDIGRGRKMIKLELSSEEVKQSVLRKARSLRHNPKYKSVFINPDRTPLQQKEFKLLREELRVRKENGEDVVIFKNKVTKRDYLPSFH